MCMSDLRANEGRALDVVVNSQTYRRLPIKTHVITSNDTITGVVTTYAPPHLKPRDVLFVSERVVAITQGRAYKITDINPSWLAKTLSRYVHKSPYGIGLASPWTMELAAREVGLVAHFPRCHCGRRHQTVWDSRNVLSSVWPSGSRYRWAM